MIDSSSRLRETSEDIFLPRDKTEIQGQLPQLLHIAAEFLISLSTIFMMGFHFSPCIGSVLLCMISQLEINTGGTRLPCVPGYVWAPGLKLQDQWANLSDCASNSWAGWCLPHPFGSSGRGTCPCRQCPCPGPHWGCAVTTCWLVPEGHTPTVPDECSGTCTEEYGSSPCMWVLLLGKKILFTCSFV